MDKVTSQSREENIPFHINMVTLAFRFASMAYHNEYMNKGNYIDVNGFMSKNNPYERELVLLKQRLKAFSKYDQYYWDILFDMNMRGKTLPAIMQEMETKDPDKEAWIKQQVEDPNGVLNKKNKVIFFYGK